MNKKIINKINDVLMCIVDFYKGCKVILLMIPSIVNIGNRLSSTARPQKIKYQVQNSSKNGFLRCLEKWSP